MAACASASEPISTNAKPRARPVSRSVTIVVRDTVPKGANASARLDSVMLKERLPTYSLLDMRFTRMEPAGRKRGNRAVERRVVAPGSDPAQRRRPCGCEESCDVEADRRMSEAGSDP